MTRLALALLIVTLPLAAQTSSLQGTIKDAQGSLVPAALVTATNQSTSAKRTVVGDDLGSFSFPQMPPGAYKLEVTKPGFSVYQSEIRLQVNVPATLSVQLELGQVSETVSVVAEAAQVNTQDATTGNAFTELQIRGLPLQTRNIVALLGA